jgi:hypothetical protein
MTPNVGNIDRIARALAGVVLLALALFAGLSGAGFWIALVVGVVMLATAGMRFCPAYTLLGVKTCKDC